MAQVLTLLGTISLQSGVWADDSESSTGEFSSVVRPFLIQHCSRCHGAEQQKGDRRFDRLTGVISSDNDLVDLQDILDQLNLGEMPPSEQPQPDDDVRREVVEWLTQATRLWRESNRTQQPHTVLRRLNSREYRNTVRDLLKIELTMFDPADAFPRDQQIEHLDNIGEELVTSGYLLQQYLAAAEKVMEKALTPKRRPAVRTWAFHDNFHQQPEIDQVHRKTNQFEFMTLFEVRGADKHEGAYGAIRDFKAGVPVDGVYEIRFDAEALNRQHSYDPEFFGTDPDEPFRLGIVPGDQKVGALHHTQPIEPLLAELEIGDERNWYTAEVWLDAGMTPRFTFENGLMDVRTLWGKVFRRYPDKLPKRQNSGIVESRFIAIKHGKFPQIRIHNVEIRGPLYRQWPTASHISLMGSEWESVIESDRISDEQLNRILESFMTRAYRRPAVSHEVQRIAELVRSREVEGRSAIDAFGDGLQAVLCSPAFLYLEEPVTEDQKLTDYGLASRLSYFLWASMPDDQLLQLAAAERLTSPDVLVAQLERMLADSRSEAFVDGFLDSWLTLRNLGATPPDRTAFPQYYQYDLATAMREETRLFFRHLLDENRNVAEFLDSDFTFVNKPLARHYEIPDFEGGGFQKVALTDSRRGGLLGQASVLTVTANGIDTSPVVRGVWLLENILGTPPSPPPPDVEPLDPDIRGAKTIRDQLEKHRSVPACNDCHRKIDPPGFALENFDPIGRWRTSYGRNTTIDASGALLNGDRFNGINEFRQLLVARQDLFIRTLSTKLLEYGIGREMTAADRSDIDHIVAQLKERGNGLHDLLRLIVSSDTFRSK